MGDKTNVHPCIQCGACCAAFRVSFPAQEMSIGGSWQVPSTMVENNDIKKNGIGVVCTLKGTDKKHRPACQALEGTIGKRVNCRIYYNRPSTCRNFLASYEDGIHRPRCDEARIKHGLRPLGREAYNSLARETAENFISTESELLDHSF